MNTSASQILEPTYEDTQERAKPTSGISNERTTTRVSVAKAHLMHAAWPFDVGFKNHEEGGQF